MPIIDGKLDILEPVKEIPFDKDGRVGTYPMLVFVIKKQQNYKKTQIAFKMFGQKAKAAANIKIGTRIRITYIAKSKNTNGYWNTDLVASEVEDYNEWKAKKDEYFQSEHFINNQEKQGSDDTVITEENKNLFNQ